MEKAVIVDIPSTTTAEVGKQLVSLRESGGAVTIGRVLTLIVVSKDATKAESAIEAANEASREHPCRVIVLIHGDRSAESSLDAQIRVGGDAGASEVVVLRLNGELADHEHSVVIPFLLPDTPIVAWWPNEAPAVPAQDPLGRLAIRRITDATNGVGQLLMTRLYREQWIFWIATNVFSIYLWWDQSLHIQGMYWVYTLNSLVGWYQWTKALKKEVA